MKTTLLTALTALLLAAPAQAALPQLAGSVDLANRTPNVVVDGAATSDGSAQVVADAGDVNGDGIADAITSAPYSDPNGRRDAGSVWVVFGRGDGASIDLASLPAGGGFRILGAATLDHFGWSAAGAGDVNGDGLADVVVGAKDADNRRSTSGSAYVIFGRRSTATVDAANLGSNGFRVDGAAANDQLGTWVAGGRDVNGDGRSDVLVAAPQADRNGRLNSGTVYAVFGTSATANIDAAALGGAGYAIDGAAAGDGLGTAEFTGDLTGDGRPDTLVGAPRADGPGRADAGAAYLVPGRADNSPVDAGTGAAYTVYGASAGDAAGSAVAEGGDYDGDGYRDLLVGAPAADNNGRLDSGSAYVLFGARGGGSVDLGTPGAAWRIDGQAAFDAAGTAVDGGGDLNADGRPELAVGSPGADSRGRSNNGSVRVFYGGYFGGVVDLATTGAPGFRADGSGNTENAGNSLAFTRDANADGWADLLVGAYRADHRRGDSGSMYYLWGYGPSNLAYPGTVATTVGQPIAPLAPAALQRTGVVSFSVSPPLPAGLKLDSNTGVISGSPAVILEQASTYTLTMTDFASSISVPISLRVAPLPGACANPHNGSGAADRLVGTSGGDRMAAGAGSDELQGLGGDDCEFGDDDVDTLSGDDGNDELHGGIEHDTLGGGNGADRLFGDEGQDNLSAGAGDDLAYGGAGYDEILAGDGNDRAFGDSDSDVLLGGAGNDRLDGGTMADKLVGGPGKDVLIGGAGNDIISDSSGANTIDAGTGNDAVNVRNGARDVVRCGKGRDHVVADRKDKLVGCEKVKRARRAKKKRR